MTQLWWLSFVDPDRPEGQRFLGVTVMDYDLPEGVEALRDIVELVLTEAWRRQCNPGGAAQVTKLEELADAVTPMTYRNRILMKPEVAELERVQKELIAQATIAPLRES